MKELGNFSRLPCVLTYRVYSRPGVSLRGAVVGKMVKITSLVLLLAFVASLWPINPDPAFACSCVAPGTPAEELARSTAVYAGKVINIIDTQPGPRFSSAHPLEVVFQVSKVWKGPAHSTLAVTTARSEVSCGYEFVKGQEYLVYARGTEDKLEASLCSRTNPLSTAVADLAALGQDNAPAAEGPKAINPTPFYRSPPAFFAFGVVATLLATAAFLALWRSSVLRRN